MPITIGGITLEHPLMNAAGECKHLEGRNQARDLAQSAVAAIEAGSFTLEQRDGNPEPTYWSGLNFAVNARGLPNNGLKQERCRDEIRGMIAAAHAAGKTFFLNVAEFSDDGYREAVEIAQGLGPDMVVINLGCPNVKVEGAQKPSATYDVEYCYSVFEEVNVIVERSQNSAPFAVKFSPVFDYGHLGRLAIAVQSFPWIRAVITSNTIPNVLHLEDGKRVLSGNGRGGMSGLPLKPIALDQVEKFRDLLPDRIAIIGCGGVQSGRDVLDFLAKGATLVQVGTHSFDHGAKVFGEILTEMIDLGWEPGD